MNRSIFVLMTALAASAAAEEGTRRMDPTDPRAKVPPLEYRSAFAGYQPFADEKIAPWRDSNDALEASGGHAGHASQSAPEPRPAPKPGGASGHGAHR